MKTVHLVQLAEPTCGGWPTYTAHLAHGLRAAGCSPVIWRVRARHEDRPRPFRQSLTYRNASLQVLEQLAQQRERLHITAASAAQADAVGILVAAGATVTVHDPTELKPPMLAALSGAKDVVCIRRAVLAHLPGLPARYVPHPYLRAPAGAAQRATWAVAYSRLDWDKGTHHIVAANLHLDRTHRVQMFGAMNRIYAHHKLRAIDPYWDVNYRGSWPTRDLWGGVQLARQAQHAVDMSTIKGDGGGTQYTFLEALDGGAALMLNDGWRLADDPELAQVATYVPPSELSNALREPRPPWPAEAVDALLLRHDATACAMETIT